MDLLESIAPLASTDEHQRRSAGQRRINIIWELTQAIVALAVTTTTLYVSASIGRTIRDPQTNAQMAAAATAAFLLLSNAFFLVIGFYFGRTNHQRTGGIGGSEAGAR